MKFNYVEGKKGDKAEKEEKTEKIEKNTKKGAASEKQAKEEKVYIIPLGGMEEVGKNMTAFQYKDEIVIVDAGLTFPEDEHLGIDVIIPDFTYLENNKDKIKSLLLDQMCLLEKLLAFCLGLFQKRWNHMKLHTKILLQIYLESFHHMMISKMLKKLCLCLLHTLEDYLGIIL